MHYPETKDMDLLYDVIEVVVFNEKDLQFYLGIEENIKNLASTESIHLYDDLLSFIYYQKDEQEACARQIAIAKSKSVASGFKYTPSIQKIRNSLKS